MIYDEDDEDAEESDDNDKVHHKRKPEQKESDIIKNH